MTIAESQGPRFDFGRVTSRTFSLIGRNFLPFFGLSVLLSGAPFFVIMLLEPALFGGGPGAANMSGLVVSLVSFLTGSILTAALTRASIDDLSGQRVSIGAALSVALAVLVPLLGLTIIVVLGVMLGMLLLIVPGLYLLVRWIVASPVLVVERLGIFPSMGRSAQLTENHRWAIFGLLVLYTICAYIVTIVAALALVGVAGATGEFGSASVTAVLILGLVQSLVSLVATVGLAAIYFELRQIKEGVDVTELAKVFA